VASQPEKRSRSAERTSLLLYRCGNHLPRGIHDVGARIHTDINGFKGGQPVFCVVQIKSKWFVVFDPLISVSIRAQSHGCGKEKAASLPAG
jgi:hypothetical protein